MSHPGHKKGATEQITLSDLDVRVGTGQAFDRKGRSVAREGRGE